MDVVCSTKPLTSTYKSTLQYNQKHQHHQQNLKSHTGINDLCFKKLNFESELLAQRNPKVRLFKYQMLDHGVVFLNAKAFFTVIQ